jgi:hypothetical protein
MLCGNTQAEIDHDTQTNAQEQHKYLIEQRLYKIIVAGLLNGETINGCNLAERMADRHDSFTDMANDGYDFMAKFKDGHLEHYRNLLTTEAKTLASVIMGK